MGSLMRVVLVADELEGFSSDEAAALRFASFLGSLRQSVERADVILSVNQDVWESAFLPRLSGGLADRLSEVTVELSPLDREGILAILESRSPGMGEKIMAAMGTGDLPSYARGVIKNAAEGWGLEPASVDEREPEPEQTAPAEFVAPVPEPEASPVPEPDPFPVPTADSFPTPEANTIPEPSPASAPVEAPVVSQAPPAAPTNFSPEAAIAAFANEPPIGEASQPVSEPAFPAPDSVAKPAEPASGAPATDFAAPPVTTGQEASTTTPADSPFQIDTGADPAVQAFQADPASIEKESAGDEPAPTDRVDSLLKQFRERYGKQ